MATPYISVFTRYEPRHKAWIEREARRRKISEAQLLRDILDAAIRGAAHE
jgi:hypothetical protein